MDTSCKKCPNGSFFAFDKAPGTHAEDCKTCPLGEIALRIIYYDRSVMGNFFLVLQSNYYMGTLLNGTSFNKTTINIPTFSCHLRS